MCRSKVIRSYLSDNPSRVTWKDTRLLLHYFLTSELETDHMEYLSQYIASEDLNDLLDYLVIRVVPKEKELKEAFRGFGCKTYQDRARGIAQEKNVKHFLHLYSHEQAMTLTELEILNRLNSFRNIHKAFPGYTPIYIVIDASAWNNHFRRETIDTLMQDYLDLIFDCKIFSKTMLAYECSLVYVPDQDATWSWDGQLGGIEGLNQDMWVSSYIVQLHTAMERFVYPYHVFCKGDDMRVVVCIPKETLEVETLNSVRKNIMSHIKETLSQLGHKINIQESYGSTLYFAFSKAASCGSIEMPSCWRKIQKTYGAKNAFLCVTDNYIGASFSNAHSCKQTTDFIPSYLVALYWSLYHLSRMSPYKHLTENQKAGMLMVPGMLGGLPIIYLHNMIVRAESDLLSPFLGLYKFCKKRYTDIAEVMENFLSVDLISREEAFLGLLQDEYSLPIRKPVSAANKLRSYILPMLESQCQNKEINNLFELRKEGISEQVVNSLRTANVYNAKIMSAIYAASPDGLLNELVRKFETSRSIIELLVIQGGYRLANRCLLKTERYISSDLRLPRGAEWEAPLCIR
ncbi:ORF1 [chu-like virus 1]|nr:ORF1 [chu-like virus 1]